MQVALANPHLVGEGFDLPMAWPFFEEYVAAFRLQERLRFRNGDFFKDSLPSTDVLVMGMILHDWNLEEKRMLLKKAYDALPDGGPLIACGHLIDAERRKNVAGLLMRSDHAARNSRRFRLYECRLRRMDAPHRFQGDVR